jgi:phosphoadenosine phosphosulfate reductase
VIGWAYHELGDQLMMTTSFQKSGMVILHMLRDLAPDVPVYFLDTGFHFRETLEFAERIRSQWHINLIVHRPRLFGEAFEALHGSLYERDADRCCELNKVEPQRELLARHQGWIAGVRRDQSETRGGAEVLELLEGGMLKVQPLALWSRADVESYIAAYRIPCTRCSRTGTRASVARRARSLRRIPATREQDAGRERARRSAGCTH